METMTMAIFSQSSQDSLNIEIESLQELAEVVVAGLNALNPSANLNVPDFGQDEGDTVSATCHFGGGQGVDFTFSPTTALRIATVDNE